MSVPTASEDGRQTGPAVPTATATPKAKMSKRQKAKLSRGIQYAILVVIAIIVALVADWPTLIDTFGRFDIAADMFPEVITGALKNTVVFTVLGFALGLAIALVVALMRLSSVGVYRWLATIYIEFFRGLPALVVFLVMGFGLPVAFPGFILPQLVIIMIALGLVSSAYMAETIRAGIQAVPRGQMEAARSLGFSPARAMVSVIIPQAFRIILPPLTNELVLLFKDSSLLLFLGVTLEERELSKYGRDLASQTANSTPILVAGLCYLLITIPLGLVVRRMEAKAQEAVK